jgi:hypothetical protein
MRLGNQNTRGCYCGLWETQPGFFTGKEIPPGFCGRCQTCGAPGHVRHHPGAVPFTGSWCDRHYRRLQFTHPATPFGCLLWLLLAGTLFALLKF